VCEQVAGVTGAAATSVMRYSGDERAVAVGAWRDGAGRGVPVNAELDFDDTNSALGRVRATRRPARADSYERAGGELPAVMRAIGLRSTVAAPVLVGDEAWGAVMASSADEEPLPVGTELRLADFADLVGLAVVNARERRRQAATGARLVAAADESRRRLEHQLHDGAHQHLVALALKLRVARSRAGGELAALLDDALLDAMATNAALREVSRCLHPAMLTERGLGAAMLALAARASVPVYLRELPGRRFPATVETTAYLVVAEALADASTRARGQVAVRIADHGDHLLVKVNYDGGAAGPGLREVAERVAALGGALQEGDGVLNVTLPLPAD
jgi:signal transduction histidine kinase